VETVNEDGTYDILFDDGDRDASKEAHRIMEPPSE
jgi:hypothetical protein